jgi:hypothetical protein
VSGTQRHLAQDGITGGDVMIGIPSARPAGSSLPHYTMPVEPMSWPTVTDDVRGGEGRPVVAVVLASGSAAGRCGLSFDTLAAHLPGAGDRHRCWSCGRSWPCGSFIEAASIVHGYGMPVLALVPADLCGTVQDVLRSTAGLPMTAGGMPVRVPNPTPAAGAVEASPAFRAAGRVADRPIEQVGTVW